MQPPAESQDDGATREMSPIPAPKSTPSPPTPAAASLATPAGDACPSCGSPMAADQRYCIDCGERRGDSRMPSLNSGTSPQPPPPPPPAYAPPGAYAAPPPRGKWSSGLALLATIGLLLMAMGVGVLIGNNGDPKNVAAQQPIVVGAGAVAAAPTDATGASSSTGKDAAATSDKASVDADAVAKKNGVKLAPKNAKIGDKCESGVVGCEDGEFTGDYFGN